MGVHREPVRESECRHPRNRPGRYRRPHGRHPGPVQSPGRDHTRLPARGRHDPSGLSGAREHRRVWAAPTSRRAATTGIKLVYGFNEGAGARSYRRFFAADLAPVSEWVLEIPGSQAHREPADDDPRVSPVAGVRHRGRCALGPNQGPLPLRHRAGSPVPRLAVLASVGPRLHLLAGGGPLGPDRRHGRPRSRTIRRPDPRAAVGPGRCESHQRPCCGPPTAHFARAGKRRVRAWLSAHGKLRECAQAAGFRAARLRLLPEPAAARRVAGCGRP